MGTVNGAFYRDVRQGQMAHDQQFADDQRKTAITAAQTRAANIAETLNRGVNPQTGEKLTPEEHVDLGKRHQEINAYMQDLYDPNHPVDKLGKNLSKVTGVPTAESKLREFTDHIGITHKAAGSSTTTPGDVLARVTDDKYGGQLPAESPVVVMKRNLKASGLTDEAIAPLIDRFTEHMASGEKTPPTPKFKQVELSTPDGKHFTANHDETTGKYSYLDGSEIPSDVLRGATPPPKAKAVKGMKFDPATGQVVNADTGQRYSRDDKDLPPDVAKMFEGQKVARTEKIDDAIHVATARGAAYQMQRPTVVEDPDHPGDAIIVPAGVAEQRKMKSISSGGFKAISAMVKEATSGKIGSEMVAFGTAYQHAELLQEAAKALANGDNRTFNTLKNKLGKEFGDQNITNFDTIAAAYTREVTKALAAGHMTDAEIASVGGTIPNNATPAQIFGAVQAYKDLMSSKIEVRKHQIDSGMQGKPFIPDTSPKGAGKKYKMTATGPNGQKAGSDDGKTWFDVKTGAAVK